jgi:hypothetical protein
VTQTTHPQTSGFSRQEVDTAAAWSYQRGSGWTVETITADDGTTGLGVTAPGGEELAFQAERVAAGVAVFEPEGWAVLGVWPALLEALEAAARTVEVARGQDVANDP